jgi:phosphotransferase system  glucose/maltose/N-acetylglucosamine-specific IIC component
MDLLHVIGIIVLVGIVLWLVNTYVTIMDPNVKKILNIAVLIILVLWLFFMIVGPLPNIRIGR